MKTTSQAIPMAALMLGAAQAGTTVGVNFCGNSYYGSYAGAPVTAKAYGVDGSSWWSTPIDGSGYAASTGSVTVFDLGVSWNSTNTWITGGQNPPVPGNKEVIYGVLDNTGWSFGLSGLNAKFPNGYVVELISANNTKSTSEVGITTNPGGATVGTVKFDLLPGDFGLGHSASLNYDSLTFSNDSRDVSNKNCGLAGFIITDQPVVVSGPASMAVPVGGTISLSTSAVGVGMLSYQWKMGGVNIEGATASTYTKSSAAIGDTGDYTVEVTSALGVATSEVAHVTVAVPTPLTWDADTGTPDAQGGGGTWNTSNANWWDGANDVVWSSINPAMFGATSGAATVTLGSTVTVGSMTFDGNYTIADQTLTLAGASTPTIITNQDTSISSTLVGTSGFIKGGTAKLSLSNGSQLAGNIVTNAGALSITGQLRSVSGLQVNAGASLELGSTNMFVGGHGDAVDNSRVITVEGGTLLMNGSFESRFGNVTLKNGATWTSNRGVTGWDALLGNTSTGAATILVSNTSGTAASTMNGSGGIHMQGAQNFDVSDVTGNSNADLVVNMILDNGGYNGGAGAVNKLGSGRMSITKQATYSGGTTVNAGTLSLDTNGGWSGLIRGTVTVKNGATLQLNANDVTGYGTGGDRVSTINLEVGSTMHTSTTQNQTLGSCVINMTGAQITGIGNSNLDFYAGGSALNTFASNTTSTISGTKVNLRQSAVTFNVENGTADNDLDVSSYIYGNSLIKAGAGTMRLNALNGYTGSTTINAGVLKIGANGSIASSSVVTVTPGAVLDGSESGLTIASNQTLRVGRTSSPAIDIVGDLNLIGTLNPGGVGSVATVTTTGGLRLGGSLNFDYDVSSNNSDTIAINGVLAIDYGFSVVLNRLGTASTNRTYTVVSGLTAPLTEADLANLPDLGQNYTWDNASDPSKLKIQFSPGSFLTWKGNLNAGEWDVGATSNWSKSSLASTFANGDYLTFDDSAATGSVQISTDNVAPGSILVNNSSALDYVFDGSLAITGVTSLTKTGNGLLTVNNVNSYTGGTVISGGTLAFEVDSLGATGSITMDGGTLRWQHTYKHTDISSRLVMVAGKTATFDSHGADVTFSSAIGGGTSASLVKVGLGTLICNASNTYTGATTINAGTLNLDAPSYNVYSGNQINIGNAATLAITQSGGANRYDFGAVTYQFGGTGGGAITTGATLNWVAQGSWTFKTNGGAKNTISGLSGMNMNHAGRSVLLDVADGTDAVDLDIQVTIGNTDGGLTKIGNGTAALSEANTYSGTTTINAGALILNNSSGSGTGSGTVNVNNADTVIGGTGSIAGTVNVNANAIIAPGVNGTGIFSTGSLNLTGKYECQVNDGSADRVTVNGNLTFASGASLAISSLATPSAPSYVIASYTGTLTGWPTITGTPTGYQVTVDATAKEIKLIKTAGYDSWSSVIADVNQRGRNDDPDGDGFSNIQEFLFGTSPISNNGSLSTTETVNGDLVLRWLQRTSGGSYQLKQSATLGNDWVNSSVSITDDGTASGDYQPKKAIIPLGSGKLFFRVEGVEN